MQKYIKKKHTFASSLSTPEFKWDLITLVFLSLALFLFGWWQRHFSASASSLFRRMHCQSWPTEVPDGAGATDIWWLSFRAAFSGQNC